MQSFQVLQYVLQIAFLVLIEGSIERKKTRFNAP